MQLRRPKTALAFIAFALSALVAAPAGAQVAEVEAEITSFSNQIGRLEAKYLQPALLESKYRMEARFNDAKVAYFTGDYQRAAFLFVDLVNKETFARFASHREALYLLGDSLYSINNHLAARRYLRRLVEMGPGPFEQDAVMRLLQIASETRDFDGVEALYGRMHGSGGTPGLQYMAGRTLYREQRYDEADAAFERASKGADFRLRAQYFRGVSLTAAGKLDKARNVFATLINSTKVVDDASRDAVELSFLALGRLAYERGQLDSAIDFYQRIPRTSRHFDRALFELTWALVSRGQFKAARRNADVLSDILFLDAPKARLVPEVKLLRADLSLKLQEYKSAKEDYQEVIDRFDPVKKEMDEFVASQGDLRVFFGALIEEELKGAEPQQLPPLVEEWTKGNETMARASRLISDIRTTSADVRESLRDINQIKTRLESSNRVQSFPKLAEGVGLGMETENQVIQLRQQLLAAEYEVLEPVLSGSDKTRWTQLAAELETAQTNFAEIPQTREDLAVREQRVLREFDRLQRMTDEVGFQLDAQRAQLDALDTYLGRGFGRPLTPEERSDALARRDHLTASIAEMETIRGALLVEIDQARNSVGVGDSVARSEAQIRANYRKLIDQSRHFLAGFHSKAAAGGAELNRINTLRGKIEPLEQRLTHYFEQMNRLVDKRADQLGVDLVNECSLLTDHQKSLTAFITASRDGAGTLAYLNFLRVRGEFTEIVLRGNVGMLDVAWQKKEDMSDEIGRLFEDRTQELKMLQDSFEEVR